MKLSLRIFSLLMVLIMCIVMYSCGGDNDDVGDGDDFSGPILDKDDDEDDDEEAPAVDDGDENQTYYISNVNQLKEMKRKGNYVLTASIDLEGAKWEPVGSFESPFEGTFDGAGYTISNFKIAVAHDDVGEVVSYKYSYSGLFGCINSATVKNVNFSGVEINAYTETEYKVIYAGVVAGYIYDSLVENCEIEAVVNAQSTKFHALAGAVAGNIVKSRIIDCSSDSDVTVGYNVYGVKTGARVRAIGGGIVGRAVSTSSISGCESKGSVTVISDNTIAYAGGIVGYLYNSKIEKTYSASEVEAVVVSETVSSGKGAACAGGIAGTASGSESLGSDILRSYSTGKVTSNGYNSSAYAGGLTGESDGIMIKHSYSASVVEANSLLEYAYAGGITGNFGMLTQIDGCFSVGNITAKGKSNERTIVAALAANISKDDLENIVKSAYLSSAVYKHFDIPYNGEGAYSDGYSMNGSAFSDTVFKNLSILQSSLGWIAGEWVVAGSYPLIND